MGEERELRAGRDYPIWPYQKWGHAARLSDRLINDYNLWRGSLGAESRAEYSEDGRVATFHAAIANAPPTYEWSLAFGDIVHNYRSALDALAWSMATLDGARPHERNEKHIYFPIKKTRTEFDREARTRLASVPDFILDRMQMVQPYHVQTGEKVEDGIGLLLNDLDIQDKHKSAIETRIIAADRTSYSITYRYVDQSASARVSESASPEWIAADDPLADGQPILRWRFSDPIQYAEITDLPLRLTVMHGSSRHDVFELIRMIDWQVAETFAVVETGKFRAEWNESPEGHSS